MNDDDVECEGNRKRRSSIDGTNRDKHRDKATARHKTQILCFCKKDTKAKKEKKNTTCTYMQDTVQCTVLQYNRYTVEYNNGNNNNKNSCIHSKVKEKASHRIASHRNHPIYIVVSYMLFSSAIATTRTTTTTTTTITAITRSIIMNRRFFTSTTTTTTTMMMMNNRRMLSSSSSSSSTTMAKTKTNTKTNTNTINTRFSSSIISSSSATTVMKLMPSSMSSMSAMSAMFSTSTSAAEAAAPSSLNKTKPRVVILGTGWGGYTLANRLDKTKFDVRVISPANHFLFTPLLPGTAVGTLEFRAIQEPVRTIIGLGEYYQAKARSIDTKSKIIHCQDIFKKENMFNIKYDYLMVATGNKTNTFNIPGIDSHEGNSILFLKHLYHARQIRNRILECFERASNINVSVNQDERQRLLSFIVVGGGPTSCEFITELYDFIYDDVSKWYPDLKNEIKLTLVEAGDGLLGSFHQSLSEYYLMKLQKRNVDVRLKTAVTGVYDKQFNNNNNNNTINNNNNNINDNDNNNNNNNDIKNGGGRMYTIAKFNDDTELPFGMMVWSAGLAPVKFVKESGLPLLKGRIEVNEYLRVPNSNGRIYALGDNSIINNRDEDDEDEGSSRTPLPPTASVAEQQAYYLSDCFNNYYYKYNIDSENNEEEDEKELPLPGPVVPALLPLGGFPFEYINSILCKSSPKFMYKNRGAMAGMGFGGGVSDLTNSDLPVPKIATSGIAAFLMWRSVYLTKQLSYTNMILIPMYWFKQIVFGRDISRF